VRAFFESNLRTITDECKLWPYSTTNGGYGQIVIAQRHYAVHVLACEAFNGPRPAGLEAIHGPCNTPGCWNGRHLSWGSHRKNMLDQARDGTRARGERKSVKGLTEADVLEIRRRWALRETLAVIAKDFNVSRSTVSNIGLRQRWRHLP
jgi:hypothetical protein